MNWRVFILAAFTFAVGLDELIVEGVLPNILDDLIISIAKAGLHIPVFALVYAISVPSYIKSRMT
jgi:DHA1 family purine base/nucleoside efflux pump-like MFS transporter